MTVTHVRAAADTVAAGWACCRVAQPRTVAPACCVLRRSTAATVLIKSSRGAAVGSRQCRAVPARTARMRGRQPGEGYSASGTFDGRRAGAPCYAAGDDKMDVNA